MRDWRSGHDTSTIRCGGGWKLPSLHAHATLVQIAGIKTPRRAKLENKGVSHFLVCSYFHAPSATAGYVDILVKGRFPTFDAAALM